MFSRTSHIHEASMKNEVSEFKNLVIDFEDVAVHGTYIKIIDSKHIDVKNVKTYVINRVASLSYLYEAFKLNKYEGSLNSPTDFTIKVSYSPKIPSRKDIEHFHFKDNLNNIVIISLEGTSKGPLLFASIRHLDFFVRSTDEVKAVKKTIEISNKSFVPAEFMFDVNDSPTIFDVHPKSGKIDGYKHTYVTFTFHATKQGCFSDEITCLIWGQDPMVMSVFALVKKDIVDFGNIKKSFYPCPLEERQGYMSCFRDHLTMKNRTSPMSMTRMFIDFGRILKSSKAKTQSFSGHTTSITNETTQDMTLEWFGSDSTFQVSPHRAEICPQNSAIFEFTFTPNNDYVFYNKSLMAQIYWKQIQDKVDYVEVPIAAKVILTGHSFPETDVIIPNVEFHCSEIFFDPCLPEMTVYTSFKITNLGIMPALFKFIPPRSSHIVVKPMLGIVKKFQIISAMMRAEKSINKSYFEEWFVELNGCETRRIPIHFRGRVTIPFLLIGDNDVIDFDEKVQIGTIASKTVPIRNNSPFHISFTFRRNFSDYIEIQPESGQIFPNEAIYANFIYKSTDSAPEEIFATCDLRVVEKLDVLVGNNYTQNFIIIVESGYAELCSFPKSQDFGVVKLGDILHTSFHLFNYGEAKVNFKLTSNNLSSDRDMVKIEPSSGEVRPKGNIKIDVDIHSNTIGINKIKVAYEELESTIINRSEAKVIFKMQYNCEIFTFFIVEIVRHSFGHIFGVHHMWNLLNVDRINELLKKGWYGDERVDLYLPECEENPETHLIVACLSNISSFESEIRLKRKKLCNCPMKEVKDSFNMTKSVYDCAHREILTLELSDKIFYSRRYLTFQIKYTIIGTTEMAYVLSMEDGRSLELRVNITTIPKSTGKISLCTQTLSMPLNSLYLALYRGVIQTFWLYNNTTVATNYTIKSEDVEAICQKYGAKVLQLLNAEGELEPNQMLPLMIKFHPVASIIYSVELPITLGKEESQFKITGFATFSKKENISKHKVQINRQILKNFAMAMTTPQCLIFNRITDWSKSEQILFIENITHDKILEYSWSEIKLKQIVDIKASPKAGILAPKESHRILITVKTYNESILTDLLITCTITDRNELYLYNKSIEKYEEVEKKLEGQFMIMENSFIVPKNTVIIRENPKPQVLNVPVHLNITYWKDAEKIWDEVERFSVIPFNIMKINVSKLFEKTKTYCFFGGLVNDEHKEDLIFILEQIISDVVFSRNLKDILKRAKYQPPPFYTQFTIEDKAFHKSGRRTLLNNDIMDECRREEIEKVFSQPAPSLVSEVLKVLIFDSIHYNFELGPAYPTPLNEKQINETIEALLNVNSCNSSCPGENPKDLYSKINIPKRNTT